MEDGTLIEWKKKARRHGETRRYNRRGGTQKDLSKLRYSMKASLINSSGRNKSSCRNRHGTTTAERRFFRYKKRKEAVPLQPTEENNQKVRRARLKRKIKVSPLARRIAEEPSSISERNRS
jgi:hypothetical protein